MQIILFAILILLFFRLFRISRNRHTHDLDDLTIQELQERRNTIQREGLIIWGVIITILVIQFAIR
jgi:uncharacterized membrane protein